jgi:hypothetical protein
MKLDRSKQLNLLNALADVYPKYANKSSFGELSEHDLANLWYLKEQGLVEGGIDMSISQSFIFQSAKITAKGMDFLADDGGLSAILGTVTVRLHEDTIKELLLSKVAASSAPAEGKTWLKKQVEIASSETIKKIISALLDEGVKHAPNIIRLFEQAT